MLRELPKSNLFHQHLMVDDLEKIDRLANPKNIHIISVAYSGDFPYQLALYCRDNPAGKYKCESGVIYTVCFIQIIPLEMLRLFSKNQNNCFYPAEKYYRDLVKQHDLTYIS